MASKIFSVTRYSSQNPPLVRFAVKYLSGRSRSYLDRDLPKSVLEFIGSHCGSVIHTEDDRGSSVFFWWNPDYKKGDDSDDSKISLFSGI